MKSCGCCGAHLSDKTDWCKVCHTVQDMEDDDDFDYDDYVEKENERMAECTCGAFVWSKKQGRMVQIADCIC